MTRLLAATAVAAGFAVASAQTSGLSSQCQNALTTVASSSEASCLAPGNLVPIFTSDGNTSVVEPINDWLNSVCSVAPCNNQTISAIVTNVTAGCGTELSLFGYDSSQNAAIIAEIQSIYPTARKVVCLKDGNTNCVTQTLTNIQDVVGPLSPNNIVQIAADALQSSFLAAYNVINEDFPALINDEAKSQVQQECGASFTDGQNPSGISQTASSAAAQGENAAVFLKAMADTGLYALFALGGVFTLAA
ncbi:hypothetical protein VNI00_004033 [Paramarasmius palmivorus]|uniref:Uncharacterized protein n=1 Tax=Paramarasmius palmivorus TaxID=297713 RepID=A0AAW0DQR1_9AGAR